MMTIWARLQVKRTCEKFATGVRGIVTGAGPLLGALQGDAVQLAKGFPDTSRYRPCGRCVACSIGITWVDLTARLGNLITAHAPIL